MFLLVFGLSLAHAKTDACADTDKVREATVELADLVSAGKGQRVLVNAFGDQQLGSISTQDLGSLDLASLSLSDPKAGDSLEKDDIQRTKRVLKLHKAGLICDGASRFNAAYLLQWSTDSDSLEVAHELAKVAMNDRVHAAPWLTALTYDRWQVSRGLEQRFGSQLTEQDSRFCMYPVKADATDTERATYDMPPITATYRRVLDANGLTQEPATLAAVEANNLSCTLKAW